MTPIAHGFLLQFQPGILNATFMRSNVPQGLHL